MNKRWRLALGILVSLLFLYLAMRKISWPDLWQLFRQGNYLYLIPAFLIIVAVSWVRAWRWRLLMYPNHHLPLPRIFSIVNIGYFFNNIFPAKAGEVVRAYLAGRMISGGIGQSLSTLLVERLLDVLATVAILVILIPFVALPSWAARGGLLFGAAAAAAAMVLVVLSRFGSRGVDWLWRYLGRIPVVGSPKLKRAAQNLVDGFGVLTERKVLPGALVGTVLVWLGYAALNYTMMAVFRMAGQLPFTAALLVLCTTGFSMVVPSSPGAMGVFEWAGVQALAVFSVSQSQAFGYMLGLHLFTNIVLIALGLVGLLAEGLSASSLRAGAGTLVKEPADGVATAPSGAASQGPRSRRLMKILMVLTYYYPHWTGLTAYAQRLAEGLAARGHQVTVATSRYRDDLALEDSHNGVRIVRMPTLLRLSRGQIMPSFLAVVGRLVRENDVVQVHTPMLETCLVGMLAHRAERKMLMTHHGDLVMPATTWDQFVQKTVGFMLDRGADCADVISIHSQDYAEHSDYLRPFTPKVVAIYPPVELPRPRADAVAAWRAELGLQDKQVVGFAGRFVEEKGFDYLLQALPLVAAKVPEVVMVYAGERSVAYEGFYQRWQHLFEGNPDQVRASGLITDHQKLADFYAMCDVFALPSRTDCFPSVQIEALLCGTPVVATNIPGAREVVKVTGMGVLVEPRNPTALAEGLVQVLRARDSYIKPYAQIREIFSTESTLSQYEALLQSMVR